MLMSESETNGVDLIFVLRAWVSCFGAHGIYFGARCSQQFGGGGVAAAPRQVTREKARIEAEAKAAAEAQAFAEQALNLEFGIGLLTQGVPGVLQDPLAPL